MNQPLVIGHACAAGEAPANTLAGVRACINANVDAMEIDVQLSADGVPVLMHDETVDRTTNLTGPVRGLPFATLQQADAGSGESVPSLDQVLQLVSGRFTVMCELKATPGDPAHDQRCVDAVVAAIARHDASRWAAIHSFNPEMVARARATEPHISAAIISPNVDLEGASRLVSGLLRRNAQAISVQHDCITPELVRGAKKRQITVWTWTADTPGDWTRLCNAGVDGIITNLPSTLTRWLDAR